MSRQHLSWGHLSISISAISQLLLARFGSNFKQRVLGTYTTDYNCHHDICPGDNISAFRAKYFRVQSCDTTIICHKTFDVWHAIVFLRHVLYIFLSYHVRPLNASEPSYSLPHTLKDYLCPETRYKIENVGPIHLEWFSRIMVVKCNISISDNGSSGLN